MIRAQVFGSAPTTIRYSTFTGGFGVLVGLVGIASLFASFIPDLVPLVLDGLAGLLFLAGGIVSLSFVPLLLPPFRPISSPPFSPFTPIHTVQYHPLTPTPPSQKRPGQSASVACKAATKRSPTACS
jgi:hypothetical protein